MTDSLKSQLGHDKNNKFQSFSSTFKDHFLRKDTKQNNQAKFRKILVTESLLNISTEVDLYQHVWLQYYRNAVIVHAKSLQMSKDNMRYCDASFKQVVSLGQLDFSQISRCHVLDLSVNRLRKLDCSAVEFSSKSNTPLRLTRVATAATEPPDVAIIVPLQGEESTIAVSANRKSGASDDKASAAAAVSVSETGTGPGATTDGKVIQPVAGLGNSLVSPQPPLALPHTPALPWAQTVVFLNLSSNLLLSLDGIEAFTALRGLDASDNLLCSFAAAARCGGLESLRVTGNQLDMLPDFSAEEPEPQPDPTQMKTRQLQALLDLSNNVTLCSLAGVALCASRVQVLDCRNCSLDSLLPLEPLRCLTVLRVDNNKLPEDTFKSETLPVLRALSGSLVELSMLGNPVCAISTYTVAILDAVSADYLAGGANSDSSSHSSSAGLLVPGAIEEKASGTGGSDVPPSGTVDMSELKLSRSGSATGGATDHKAESTATADLSGSASTASTSSAGSQAGVPILAVLDYQPVNVQVYTYLERAKAELEKEKLIRCISTHYINEMNLISDIHSSLLAKQHNDQTKIEYLVRHRTSRLEAEMGECIAYIREQTARAEGDGGLTLQMVRSLDLSRVQSEALREEKEADAHPSI